MATSLQAKQAAVVSVMLNFNKELDTAASDGLWSSDWKVLVYDAFGRDIIAPLFNVAELRRQGVTLHLMLDAARDGIPDVPAIYFVSPTDEAIRRIAADAGDGLYSKMYVNFVSPAPRPLLESLARATIANNSVASISKLFDQFLGFACVEPSLFSLNMRHSFVSYNDPRAADAQIEGTMKAIATGLLSVFACMGVPPIIKCQSDGPARMVAQMLDTMFRDYLGSGAGSVFATTPAVASQPRPLCIILDRSLDLSVPLRHSSSYQGLVDDLVGCHSRKVVVNTVSPDGGKAMKQSYDLDVNVDSFWAKHRRSLYPTAIEGHKDEMNAVTDKETAIRRTAGPGIEDAELESTVTDVLGAKGLAEAVDSLPALLKQKKILEMHTNIMNAVMDEIQARHVPTYFELEKSLHKRDEIFALLGDPTRGNLQDKARLAAVYVLSASTGLADAEELKRAISTAVSVVTDAAAAVPTPPATPEAVSKAMAAIDYAITLRRTQATLSGETLPPAAAASGPASAGGSKLLGLLGKTTTNLLTKARSLVSGEDALPVTRVVQTVCDGRSTSDADGIVTLDPKLPPGVAPSGPDVPFSQAVVFVIGGGCFNEVNDLAEFAKNRKTPLDLVYGTTEMCRPDEFLAQFAELGAAKMR